MISLLTVAESITHIVVFNIDVLFHCVILYISDGFLIVRCGCQTHIDFVIIGYSWEDREWRCPLCGLLTSNPIKFIPSWTSVMCKVYRFPQFGSFAEALSTSQ